MNVRHHFLLALAAVAIVVGAQVACDKVPLTSPTGSTITLSIDRAAVPIGGTAVLTAVVTESSGTPPHNGTMVTFSAPFGTVSPQEAPTVGGVAKATFTGTASGTAKVSAFSGAAKATEVELKVGGAAAERVTVRTEPATIPQAGGQVTVIANVQDIAGGVLPSTPVNFSTDNGSLSSNTAVTDANGEARVTLNTSRASKVTANVGTKTAEFTVAVLAAPTVTITCPTTTQSVGVPVTCTITPAVATGGAAIQSVTVNWGDGTGDILIGSVTGATTVSHAYSSPGAFTATAAATDLNNQRGTASAAVVVQRVNPTITITGPSSGTATVGVPVTFTVTPPANPPQPITNVTVDFGDGTSRNLGVITGPTSFTKTFSADGGYTVTATVTDASNQRGSSSVGIVVTASQPGATLTGPSSATVNTTTSAFTVGATASSGTTIRSVVVVDLDNGDRELYRATAGGTFTTSFNAAGNHRLEARVTDSTGATATARHQVNVQ